VTLQSPPEPLTAAPNPTAAQNIVDAAQKIEQLHNLSNFNTPLISKKMQSDRLANNDNIRDQSFRVEIFDNSEMPEIHPSNNRDVFEGIGEEGWETLAFYKSFRYINSEPIKGKWGVFFIKDLFLDLVAQIAGDTGLTNSLAYRALVRKVYTHELFHYHIDAICLQKEAYSQGLIYRPYRALTSALPISEWYEESLANYYGLLRLKRDYGLPNELRDYIHRLVLLAPGAYALGGSSNCSWPRRQLAMQLSASMKTAGVPMSTSVILEQRMYLDTRFSSSDILVPFLNPDFVPVYWVSAPWLSGATPAYHAVKLTEIESGFIKKYLQGSYLGKTKHDFYRIDNGEKVKLPNPHDKDIRSYEFDNIRKKAGLTSIDFAEARKQTEQWTKNVPRREVKQPIK
jgi:hypothetical protein